MPLTPEELSWIAARVRAWRDVSRLEFFQQMRPMIALTEAVARRLNTLDDPAARKERRERFHALERRRRAEGWQIDATSFGKELAAEKVLSFAELVQAWEKGESEAPADADLKKWKARLGYDAFFRWNDDHAARVAALPEPLAGWLERQEPVFLQTFPGSTSSPDDRAVAAACVAYAPDPEAALQRFESVRQEVGQAAAPCRLIERVLVYGALRAAWPRAASAIELLLAGEVAGALHWLAEHVYEVEQEEKAGWVRGESAAAAALLAAGLLRGCECWRRWSDFSLESPVRAAYVCALRHSLSAWDGTEELRNALRKAAVSGWLGRTRPMINEFRHGMLAKSMQEPLAAGPVLRCQHPLRPADPGGSAESEPIPPCNLLVAQDDRCARQHKPGRVNETSWWLWRKGNFRPATCRRCETCGWLYFQPSGDCPGPDTLQAPAEAGPTKSGTDHTFDVKATRVWILARRLGLDALLGEDPGWREARDEESRPAHPERLVEAIRSWPESQERTLALALVEGRLAVAIGGMNPPPSSADLKGSLLKVVKRIRKGQTAAAAPAEALGKLVDQLLEEVGIADAPGYPVREARRQVEQWPDDDVKAVGLGLVGYDAAAGQEPPRDRRLNLEAALRLASHPDLPKPQQLAEVATALDGWPEDDANKALLRRLFDAKGATNGQPLPEQATMHGAIRLLAQRLLGGASQPAGGEAAP